MGGGGGGVPSAKHGGNMLHERPISKGLQSLSGAPRVWKAPSRREGVRSTAGAGQGQVWRRRQGLGAGTARLLLGDATVGPEWWREWTGVSGSGEQGCMRYVSRGNARHNANGYRQTPQSRRGGLVADVEGHERVQCSVAAGCG